MIKLFSLKQEKEKEASAAGSEKKVAPGLIRMQKGEPPWALASLFGTDTNGMCLGLPSGAARTAERAQCTHKAFVVAACSLSRVTLSDDRDKR
jgi:hypothetical protein